jgi:hypothetical protein
MGSGRSRRKKQKSVKRSDSQQAGVRSQQNQDFEEETSVRGVEDKDQVAPTIKSPSCPKKASDNPKDKKKALEAARNSLEEMSQYFNFGIECMMIIPVQKIHPPPATMCYWGVPEDHVVSITKNMCSNQGWEPKPADVLVHHKITGRLVSFQKLEDGKQNFFVQRVQRAFGVHCDKRTTFSTGSKKCH